MLLYVQEGSVAEAYAGKQWNGLNLLGKLLTELRDETLGLIAPQNRKITPISQEDVESIKSKTIPTKKMVPSKNTYSTDGEMVFSILGGIIGDIVGSSREGYSHNTLSPRKLLTVDSHITDDTILTIAVANSDMELLKSSLQRWSKPYIHAGFGHFFKEFIYTGEPQVSNGNGGAIYWEGNNANISNCCFVNNTATYGGANYFENNVTNSNINAHRIRWAFFCVLD